MKFFVDTADVAEIRDLAATGLVDGITTNPSLVAKTGRSFLEVVQEICSIVPGPVSAEVTATDTDTMIEEGRKLAKIADNVTIKVPLTWDGLKACKALSDEGIRTNMTLCFQPLQAMMVAKAGAFLVSPFIGRIDDTGAVIERRIDASSGHEALDQAALAVARRETEAGNFHGAHDALRLARELSAPRAGTDAVAALLRERETAAALNSARGLIRSEELHSILIHGEGR